MAFPFGYNGPFPTSEGLLNMQQPAQQGGLLGGGGGGGAGGWFNNNRNTLLAIGSSLLANRQNRNAPLINAQNAMVGVQADQNRRLLQRQMQEQEKQRNATVDWLMQNRGMSQENAQAAVTAGGPVLSSYFGKAGDPYKSVGGVLYNTDTKEWIVPPEGVGGGTGEHGLSPVLLQDPDGKYHLGQTLKSGGLEPINLPEGWAPVPGVQFHDLGTSIMGTDKAGAPIASFPKDVAGAAQQAAEGKNVATLEAAQPAKQALSQNLAKLADVYLELNKQGEIVNPDNSILENLTARAKSSGVGQAVGGALGTEAQSIRERINNARPLLIQTIRQATNMSARAMDSNRELQFYLQAATDPTKDVYSNLVAIQVLDDTFGMGGVLEQVVPPEMLTRIKAQAENERRYNPIVITPDQLEGGSAAAPKITTHEGMTPVTVDGKTYYLGADGQVYE